MNDIHLEVGMKVYAIPYGNARLRKREPFCAEGTVTKVGRKYAYIKFGHYNAKWAIKKEDRENQNMWPGYAVADDNASYRLFPSKEACEEFIAAMDDANTISSFSTPSGHTPSLWRAGSRWKRHATNTSSSPLPDAKNLP